MEFLDGGEEFHQLCACGEDPKYQFHFSSIPESLPQRGEQGEHGAGQLSIQQQGFHDVLLPGQSEEQPQELACEQLHVKGYELGCQLYFS